MSAKVLQSFQTLHFLHEETQFWKNRVYGVLVLRLVKGIRQSMIEPTNVTNSTISQPGMHLPTAWPLHVHSEAWCQAGGHSWRCSISWFSEKYGWRTKDNNTKHNPVQYLQKINVTRLTFLIGLWDIKFELNATYSITFIQVCFSFGVYVYLILMDDLVINLLFLY